MTAPPITRSAYPRTVEDLIPHARDLADHLGEVPSRNKLMKTFKVGADKANALLAELTAAPAPTAPAEQPTAPADPMPEGGDEPTEPPEPPPIAEPPAPAEPA